MEERQIQREREREREHLCDMKKAWSPVLFLSLLLLAGPKVEKCLAHLLPHPPGEDIPTI